MNSDEQAWQELAEQLGIPERDRLPSSFEVERERLTRVIVDGQLARVRLDAARARELADERDDVVVVDFEQRPERRPWRHPRDRFEL